MLLSLMRKHAQSWLIKAVIAIIAVVFVLYFGSMRQGDRDAKTAKVNGDLITTQEYKKQYFDMLNNLQRQYKDLWNDELIKALDIKTMALNSLISQRLINQEAERLGLEVTKEEIQDAVMEQAAFQINGQFNMDRYQDLLSRNGTSTEEFEESLGQELLYNKLRQFIFAFSMVTDQEVHDDYSFNNEKVKISFVQFKPEKFKESVKPDEAGMKTFFEEQKEQYRVPKKTKFAYIDIDPKEFEDGIEISDDDITGYYEDYIDTFSEAKQVKARHILFKLQEEASEEEEKAVKQKAEPILKEARGGKDFSELATKYSEGPTKVKGGDLGYFSKGQMVKPFEDAAFGLKSGEISGLVRTQYGYHIIKVEDIKDARTKTLDEVREQIIKTLKKNNSADMAYEKGQLFIDQMPYDAKLSEYAKGHNLQTKFTKFLGEQDWFPVIAGNKEVEQLLFSLQKNETSDLIELKGKYYIFQVDDIQPSYLPELSAVADKVNEDYKSQLAAKEAKAAAEAYLDQLKNGASWEDLAKEKGLEIAESKFSTRQEPFSKIGYEPELQEKAFTLNEDNRYPDKVFSNSKGSFVVRWEAHQGIDEKKYQKEKDQQRMLLSQKKHRRLFEKWLDDLRSRADIDIITPPR